MYISVDIDTDLVNSYPNRVEVMKEVGKMIYATEKALTNGYVYLSNNSR